VAIGTAASVQVWFRKIKSMRTPLPPFADTTTGRRGFVQGLLLATALATLGWPAHAFAAPAVKTPAVLSGTELDLDISRVTVNYSGKASVATAVNGSVPGPLIRLREGDSVTIRVKNSLDEMTSIHWHGLILPADMDGVPGISFGGIAPGETFTYRFVVKQSGTFWYHAHTLAEQTGLYGPMIIEPRSEPPLTADRDYTIMLSDWTDEAPLQVYLNLKKMSSYYNFAQPTVGDFASDADKLGLSGALSKRAMWNKARMNPTDLSDVSAATYTYLLNGAPSARHWTGIARKGERVRLRFIGAGTATYFDVRIPGLMLTVVAADGQPVEPVDVDEFRIGPGETYDVIATIADDRAYAIFAQSMDRTGFVHGVLAPHDGMTAQVPAIDPGTWLDPIDMMGAMAGMGPGQNDSGMAEKPPKVHHARTEYGPNTDMRVDFPRTNLDDPGIGLRRNGRRTLTYADLRTSGSEPDIRPPGRDIELHLTGNMERFVWAIDGVKLNDSKPLHFTPNERLRIILVNDTMMTHPMHLHGMWSDLESPDGRFQVRKHTISVQPAQRVTFRVTADAMGRWAFHCHLLYHMAAGMFREVVVA
jgi:FtsP/CotA-like multicopper oxidase with cupredoxin domain